MKISRISKPSSQESLVPLTARQREVFEIIQTQLQKSNIVPSLRELGLALGIASVNGVRCHLAALERKGYIQRNIRFSRSITLLTQNSKFRKEIPVSGKISNCRFQKSSELEAPKLFNTVLNGQKDCVLIQFQDESLSSEYSVQKGDFLLLRSSRTLKKGECFCIVDASQEVYIVRSNWNEEENEWEFHSCGVGHERIKIVKPTILGMVVTLLRFNINGDERAASGSH